MTTEKGFIIGIYKRLLHGGFSLWISPWDLHVNLPEALFYDPDLFQ